ncbi:MULTISPECIES: efflux RND transporter periplasmic adaptor subunit [unclassified Polaromonas]|jgi:multidrug efflux system membrane fusion protein|uniref:efflux RND transporter periplasmic adaptor subunit n=1 Tax=unclassified Polaromonas TaxID=2638319 RepID=UPI000BDAEF59|nr:MULTISPECIES: efflux RND transporter periplasmic adaptor subunit [unclassified Polaromonas]OYY37056.1 MAG: efflux transporter periplasmic adaptor subunit [Polaromonas sp. 35-63-35]OYZ20676.1 MAG: efflux transporter periplasmic adaptor subunit [Polaromonas sp. 16-63-31]OYZ78813.1 MAG: efflux transporter periplasmic adaptor subunit [Polaromonas sp. 24-63-21]OZA49673.1 MAG: efflux transporter periplasmic adaptor subunit [Polaromonas sp. 17-63-33]OZA89158.1 MAG: efflux transporter periplasmic a
MDPKSEAPTVGPETLPRKRLSRRAILIGSLIAVLLLAGTGWLAWRLTHPAADASTAAPGGAARRGPPATTVGVATAERASIPILLDALGTVTPQATVKVRPQVSGVLQKVLFKEGQMLRAGELMATIDPRQFELALQQASGQRQRDEAQLDSARVTLQRFKTLLDQDSIARQEVDSQAALVKQLEGTVVIDKANEGAARLNLGYTRVVAPVSGRVGLRAVDVGNVVNPSDANGIALITQVTPIDVVFSIPQDQVGELQQAVSAGTVMKVTALDRTRSGTLDTGVFASLDNQIDTTTGTVKAKARFANSKLTLFPSQFVNVQLLVRTIDNAVVVPVTAVRLGASGDYVYVLNAAERTVSLRPVKRGPATVDKIVIASGLQVGERVITEGADRLKDGARVVLPGDAPGAGRAGGRRPQGAASAPRADNPAPGAAPIPRPAGSASGAPASAAPATAGPPVALAPPAPPAVSAGAPPGAEQRKRFLEQVKDDPEALARRTGLLAAIDRGDAAALARWHQIMERRRQGAQAPAQ